MNVQWPMPSSGRRKRVEGSFYMKVNCLVVIFMVEVCSRRCELSSEHSEQGRERVMTIIVNENSAVKILC